MSDAVQTPETPESLWANLRTLAGSFPAGTKPRLALYVIAQVVVSMMDMVGLAAVLPIMQVLMGESLDDGYLGVLHRLLGEPDRTRFVVLVALLMVAVFALKAVASVALAWWSTGLTNRLQVTTSAKLLRSYLDAPYLERRQSDSAEAIRRIDGSVIDSYGRVLGSLLGLVSAGFSIIFVLGLLLYLMPVPTLVAIGYFGITVYALQLFLSGPNRRAGQRAQETAWWRSLSLLEAIRGFREIRMHDAQDVFVEQYERNATQNVMAGRQANVLNVLPRYVLETVTMSGIVLLLGLLVSAGSVAEAMPTFSLFVVAVIKLLPTMSTLSATLGNIRVGSTGLALTAEALRAPNRINRQLEAAPSSLAAGAHEIVVDDVSFRYPDGTRDVLQNVSFEVSPGSSLAICGSSGSGKTTLVDIILGLIPPTSGQVRVGGIDTSTAGSAWHTLVAYVPQDVYVVDRSFAQNIAFGVPTDQIDLERVWEAIDRTHLREVVEAAPHGIDTKLGEFGARVSGGQRQRIGIARALYRSPSVLVMDEATSALDNETERQITETIESLSGEITTILIAHRLSSVRNVDHLIFLEDGKVAATGSFDEVRETSASFARLVELGRLDADEPTAGAQEPDHDA